MEILSVLTSVLLPCVREMNGIPQVFILRGISNSVFRARMLIIMMTNLKTGIMKQMLELTIVF